MGFYKFLEAPIYQKMARMTVYMDTLVYMSCIVLWNDMAAHQFP